MFLTKEEEKMVEGKYGIGVERAIKILIRFGEVFGAEKLVKVVSTHATPSRVDPDWLEEISEGAKTRTYATLNPVLIDAKRWKKMGISGDWAKDELDHLKKIDSIYKETGVNLTFTCIPYLTGNVPRQGDFLSWAGSSGQVIANSVFGARSNRDAGALVEASALTGRTPYMNLLKKENRYGEVLVKLNSEIKLESYADYGALGYYIGDIAKNKNVVLEGVSNDLSFEQSKYLLSPMPVSGSVAICHIVGLTPEAPTIEEALGGKKPSMNIMIEESQLREAWEKLNTAKKEDIDLVIFGCPHCSITELRDIALLLYEKKIHENVKLLVATSSQIFPIAERMGYVELIERAGGLVVTDSCIGPRAPYSYKGVSTVATNSARAAHYIPRTAREVSVLYDSKENCIDAAISGKIRR